jgi:hypothetical protein
MSTDILGYLNAMHKSLERFVIGKEAEEKKMLEDRESIRQKLGSIDIDTLDKAGIALQKMSEHQRKQACEKLQELCTFALQYSLSPDYEMKIVLAGKSKPVVDVFVVRKSSGLETSPMDDNGGGIIDIISVGLRIVALHIHDPFIDGPIILDEPYKMLSKEYIPLIAEFLKRISQDFGRQIIICSHNDYLRDAADSRIEVVSDDSITSRVYMENENGELIRL